MKYRFDPQPDITAYELALLLSRLTFGTSRAIGTEGVEFIDPMPPELERHFIGLDERRIR